MFDLPDAVMEEPREKKLVHNVVGKVAYHNLASDMPHVPSCRQHVFGFAHIQSHAHIHRMTFDCTKGNCNIPLDMLYDVDVY